MSLREKEFVLAAHAIGAKRFHIALRHMLPNALAPLIVAVTLGMPTAIFTEAGLSFLGFGINDPLPSWGKMVADSSSYIRVYWYLGLFPTLLYRRNYAELLVRRRWPARCVRPQPEKMILSG